ncbi:hypothetical protein OCK74_08150 [Chitinophagaceae bacterium LB-8]|uniref:Uncharacterized protein n=1 Tax=Paraflavisolibacter caeni TaxID=2982496 RepID=A0A9X3BHS3_9BACT|nr:hypothetical protein [Paraflavisolibacter caeni]MCU7549083.1 hypothetical protein [Paraflavisolibacter caeni]
MSNGKEAIITSKNERTARKIIALILRRYNKMSGDMTGNSYTIYQK